MTQGLEHEDGVMRYWPTDFHAARGEEPTACMTVFDRMAALLDAYGCFNEPIATTSPPVHPSAMHHHHHHHHHPHHGGCTTHGRHATSGNFKGGFDGQRPTSAFNGPRGHSPAPLGGGGRGAATWNTGRVRRKGDWLLSKSPVIRTIIGLLNKISDRNYTVIRARIVSVHADNLATAADICEAVLTKCYQEDCYLPLYTRLLSDMRLHAELEVGDALAAFVRAIIEADTRDHLASYVSLLLLPASIGIDYDQFCAAAKMKRYAIGKNRAVLSFIRSGLVQQPTSGDYMLLLLQQLRCTTSGDQGYGDQHVELTLDFITDFIKSFPNIAPMCTLNEAFDVLVLPNCSARCKFKVMDVRDLLVASNRNSNKAEPAGHPRLG